MALHRPTPWLYNQKMSLLGQPASIGNEEFVSVSQSSSSSTKTNKPQHEERIKALEQDTTDIYLEIRKLKLELEIWKAERLFNPQSVRQSTQLPPSSTQPSKPHCDHSSLPEEPHDLDSNGTSSDDEISWGKEDDDCSSYSSGEEHSQPQDSNPLNQPSAPQEDKGTDGVNEPFRCNNCVRVFPNPSQLRRHMLAHTKEKCFHCDVCGRGFSLKSNLKMHYRTHTQEKPFECDVCHKRFARNQSLKLHSYVHGYLEKPFKCQQCEMRFTTSTLLKQHSYIHAKEVAYKCELCHIGFSTAAQLSCHLNRRHSK